MLEWYMNYVVQIHIILDITLVKDFCQKCTEVFMLLLYSFLSYFSYTVGLYVSQICRLAKILFIYLHFLNVLYMSYILTNFIKNKTFIWLDIYS